MFLLSLRTVRERADQVSRGCRLTIPQRPGLGLFLHLRLLSVMGSAAPAVTQALPSLAPPVAQVEVQEPEPAPTAVALPEPSAQPEELRLIVLKALSEAGQRMVASMLETGEWKVEGNEVVIKVASSATVIDMSFGADAKRILIATASGFLGRPMKAKRTARRYGAESGERAAVEWWRTHPGRAGSDCAEDEREIRR